MKEAGLVDHEFNTKAILDEKLLTVAGLHPAPDRYRAPSIVLLDFVSFRSSHAFEFWTRSAPSTPSDLPPELTPTSRTTSPPPASVPCPQETSVIEVVTSPEDVPPVVPPTDLPPDVHPSSPLPPPIEELPSSHKRPRIDAEGTEATPIAAGPSEPVFPAPVINPRMDPQAGAFNMSKALNRADVEVLTPRTFRGIRNLVLSHAFVIPATVTTMVEKYAYSLRNGEMLRRELQETKAFIRAQCAEFEEQARERENKLKEELDTLKNQMVEKYSQIAMLTMENAAIKASTMQAYARGREEGASSAVLAFKESAETYRQASAYYVDGFATCLAQFKNIGNLPPDFDLSFVNVRADGFRNVDVGPSG
ncbi:hypothetical protein Salat_0687300 [Sesamum alatum]|uniref:Uncharacterized protein n=1 Tax=Sesamum alatum TaxID=300844 RepID=A0AAE1YR75_9LAMI|nr:hypothetical protein Salat_0687300 [Sesamum alatum]